LRKGKNEEVGWEGACIWARISAWSARKKGRGKKRERKEGWARVIGPVRGNKRKGEKKKYRWVTGPREKERTGMKPG